MIKFRRRHARVIIDQLLFTQGYTAEPKRCTQQSGTHVSWRVHTPTRIHNHPNRVQLRMRRPKNILVPVKEQARRIEVVLRVLRVPDLVLQSRLGQLHGLLILFGRLDELGGRLRCGESEEEPRRAAHRHRGNVAPEGRRAAVLPWSGGCSSARGCPSTQGTPLPATCARGRPLGVLGTSCRRVRSGSLPRWARLGSLSVTRLLV